MTDVRRFGDEAYSWVSSNHSPGEYSLFDRKGHHLNTDDTLLRPDSPGGVWKADSYRDDHRVSSISTDAGLDVELDPYNLDPGMP